MRSMSDCSVDLIATDPPYNSGQNYDDFDDRWDSDKQYLNFMELRLIEMHRILKDNGSFYLHCDASSSHYLKIMLDKIFSKKNFRREIIWALQRPSGFKTLANNWIRNHDIIFYYVKSSTFKFNKQFERYGDKEYPLHDVWSHIQSLQSQGVSAREGTGYSTQKPITLYEKIISASSNPGDIVLDPFCGSGTTLVAAKLLQRFYIGIDKNKNSIYLSKKRLQEIIL